MRINGGLRYTTGTFNPVFDSKSNIVSLSCVARNITGSGKHLLKIEAQNTALRE
jgi:hypothetical protein